MNLPSISITTDSFRVFVCQLLRAYSVYEVDAEVTVQRLLNAHSLGHTQLGLNRIPELLKSLDTGDIDPRGMCCVLNETPAITFMTGNQSLVEVSCSKAVDSIVQKAKQLGISLCVIKNSQNMGAPGVYSHLIAEQQCIGYCITSSGHAPRINLPGQTEASLKSHPASWSLPATEVQDAITIEFFTTNHQQHTGDPQMLPLEGTGGILLSVIKGMLTSVLAGRAFPTTKTQGTYLEQAEHLLLAIDPSHFGGMGQWNKEISKIQQSLAQSSISTAILKKQPLPEKITINQQIWQMITPYAEKRKIALPS